MTLIRQSPFNYKNNYNNDINTYNRYKVINTGCIKEKTPWQPCLKEKESK